MTTKELINQYVTAHADNRWMDASELEALLTEFAEKLQEPASEDLEKYKEFVADELPQGSKLSPNGEFTIDVLKALIKDAVKLGAQWQREQMLKDAIDSQVKWCNHGYPDIHMEDFAVLDEVQLPKGKFKIGDKVKVIIIKE